MATVNFSVPDDVKEAFDRTFEGRNKSAVVTDLMRRAVAEAERDRRRLELFRRLTERRRQRPAAGSKAVRKARGSGRP